MNIIRLLIKYKDRQEAILNPNGFTWEDEDLCLSEHDIVELKKATRYGRKLLTS